LKEEEFEAVFKNWFIKHYRMVIWRTLHQLRNY
jgi:hypothetical protein